MPAPDMSSDFPAPPGFAGACREVTVLFSDLEGFTALTEQVAPEEVVSFLNRYFTAMADPIEHFGGRIDSYMGDAMLVVWDSGHPGQDARNAAQAALAMLTRMEQLQRERLAEGKRPVKMRIGLCSGKAIVGEIGSPRFRQWTVIGDVVNTASRLEALNKQFHTDILIADATYQLIKPWAKVRSLGPVKLKGRREALECHALLDWREA